MLLQDQLKKNPYILLTPGPLSTSPSVRSAMWYDSCTWDQDYKNIVTDIHTRLLSIANCDPKEYTTVLMQGSGTFGVEAVLGSSIDLNAHTILILENGVYGKRMVEMAKILRLPHFVYSVAEDEIFSVSVIRDLLEKNPQITHLAMVHCETTTGILNNLKDVSALANHYQKYFIVDAMSSFAGIEFDITALNIDFLISSANKCIQGVPGFSFVICKTELLEKLCQNHAKSLSLDLYGQWQEMRKDPGKWRYTSPTHVVLAFRQALLELEEEGGIVKRAERYRNNQALLVTKMCALGYEAYIHPSLQSPIITSFLAPDHVPHTKQKFIFSDFYAYLKSNGFVIYPGKISHRNTFRIATIGHLFAADVQRFLEQVESYASLGKGVATGSSRE